VVFTADDGTAYSVPYAGYAGDYQAIDPITPVMSDGEVVADLPSVASLTACAELIELDCIDPQAEYDLMPDGATYTLDTTGELPDVPYTLVHFQHQVEKLQVTVLDAATGRPVDRRGAYVVDLMGVERNETGAESGKRVGTELSRACRHLHDHRHVGQGSPGVLFNRREHQKPVGPYAEEGFTFCENARYPLSNISIQWENAVPVLSLRPQRLPGVL
jgi:hypothetical protein